ncbi:MAG: alpha/beta fold hydrolase [Candidatus Sungbacteria bacterium]|nr:alpha/beta fold hydrolase [Candidatus Sungbacteria bacterium]
MIPVLLTQIKTSDGVTLDGIYVPPKRKSRTALIWVHGLTSSFYSSQKLISGLSSRCQKLGIGYFKFNNRGHDIVARGPKRFLGTVFEKFEDCILDVRAMINEAERMGYKNIILAGHSTGANKIVYYMHKTGDKRIKGLMLLGAVSDIVAEIKRIGRRKFEKNFQLAKRLCKKDPSAIFTSNGYLFSAGRNLSLFTPGRAEDTFPYYHPNAPWRALNSIRTSLAVIFGSRDEHLDRPAKKLIEVFHKNAPNAKSFSGIVIKGTNHSFRGKEKELAREIINWIKRAIV